MKSVSGPGTLSAEAQSRHAWPCPFVKGLSAQDAQQLEGRGQKLQEAGRACYQIRLFIPE